MKLNKWSYCKMRIAEEVFKSEERKQADCWNGLSEAEWYVHPAYTLMILFFHLVDMGGTTTTAAYTTVFITAHDGTNWMKWMFCDLYKPLNETRGLRII